MAGGTPCGGSHIDPNKVCRVATGSQQGMSGLEHIRKKVEAQGTPYKRDWKQIAPVRGHRLGQLKVEHGKLKWPSHHKGEEGITLEEDDLKNQWNDIAEQISNGGPGSGCHGDNCGRKGDGIHAAKMDKWSSSMASDVEEQVALGEISSDPGEVYDYLKTSYRADAPSHELFNEAYKDAVRKLRDKGVLSNMNTDEQWAGIMKVANAGTSEGVKKAWETRKRGGFTSEQLTQDPTLLKAEKTADYDADAAKNWTAAHEYDGAILSREKAPEILDKVYDQMMTSGFTPSKPSSPIGSRWAKGSGYEDRWTQTWSKGQQQVRVTTTKKGNDFSVMVNSADYNDTIAAIMNGGPGSGIRGHTTPKPLGEIKSGVVRPDSKRAIDQLAKDKSMHHVLRGLTYDRPEDAAYLKKTLQRLGLVENAYKSITEQISNAASKKPKKPSKEKAKAEEAPDDIEGEEEPEIKSLFDDCDECSEGARMATWSALENADEKSHNAAAKAHRKAAETHSKAAASKKQLKLENDDSPKHEKRAAHHLKNAEYHEARAKHHKTARIGRVSNAATDGMKCPDCGAACEEGDEACPKCGMSLDSQKKTDVIANAGEGTGQACGGSYISADKQCHSGASAAAATKPIPSDLHPATVATEVGSVKIYGSRVRIDASQRLSSQPTEEQVSKYDAAMRKYFKENYPNHTAIETTVKSRNSQGHGWGSNDDIRLLTVATDPIARAAMIAHSPFKGFLNSKSSFKVSAAQQPLRNTSATFRGAARQPVRSHL